jgi:hypothetical protein
MIKNIFIIIVFILFMMSGVIRAQSTVPEKVVLTTEGNAKDFTKDQKDFLQATLDDLLKIGRKNTAENLNKYIAEGHATISKDHPGTVASTKCPTLGYLDPISSNQLNINQDIVDLWIESRQLAAKSRDRETPTKRTQKSRRNVWPSGTWLWR